MYDAILVITGLVIVFLCFRLVMKFREMSSWKDEDTIVGGGNSALPPDLRELKIEEPSENTVNRLDSSEENRGTKSDLPPPLN